MVAAAFKITATFKARDGSTKMRSLTVSDVANAYAIYEDGTTNAAIINTAQDVALTDLILSAAGTDTTQLEIFLNGASTGTKILNATSLYTGVIRPLQQAPLRIPRGATLTLKQLA